MPPPPLPISIPTPLPAPLPPHLLTALQSRLTAANAIPPLLTSLQTACAASDWESALRARVLEILREGGVGSREEVVGRIVGEVKREGEGDEGDNKGWDDKGRDGDGNEEGKEKGNANGNGNDKGGKGIKRTDVRIPEEGIRAGTKVVRGVLEECVEVRPEVAEKDFWA